MTNTPSQPPAPGSALELRLRRKYVTELRSRTCEHFDGHTAATLVEDLPLESADRPVIVALCGSTRFWEQMQEANVRETAAGKIVVAPGCNMKEPHALWAGDDQADELKQRLDDLHRRKIDLADEVLVVAPGGYIGDSTRGEVDYATRLGLPIRYVTDNQPRAAVDPLLQQALAVIRDLYDPDPCSTDHHGHCQPHFQADTDCPHARAAALLKQFGADIEED